MREARDEVYKSPVVLSESRPVMKLAGLAALVFFSLLLSAPATDCQTANPPGKGIDVYDGFESPQLSPLWETSRFTPGAVTMQSEIVRSGRGAAKVTLHSHDTFEGGKNGKNDSERDELMESHTLFAHDGAGYEYSFSIYFPKEFPIVPTRLVIAQWKQYCVEDNLPCNDDSPVLALRYIGGELLLTQSIGSERIVLSQAKDEYRGRWLDFRIRARFSSKTDGRIQVWLDGKQIVDFHGITANAENQNTGYRSPSLFYFKMGLYRDVMAEPMTAYIDEYRKRELTPAEF
jgi:hypothetical protein